MLRVATSAVAVAATVADSSRSGLGVARPVTRALRGAALLPYWVVTGLSSGATVARSLALLGLSLGGVLLTLALFGLLPASLAGPAAALGGSAVLCALAYSALRTGTLLHGLVLLSPVVPLVAYAAQEARSAPAGSADAAGRGVGALLAVVALCATLMLLGSLPATTGSVWAALDRRAERVGIAPVPRGAPAHQYGRRRLRGLLVSLIRPAMVALAGAAGALVGTLVLRGQDRLATWLDDSAVWWHGVAAIGGTAIALTALVVAGAEVARRRSRQLQVLRKAQGTWKYDPVTHPAGTSVTWAVLYGSCYLVVAVVLAFAAPPGYGSWSYRAALLASLLAGLCLVLVLPLWLPWRAIGRIVEQESARVATVPAIVEAHAREARQKALIDDLVVHGTALRGLVERKDGSREPTLTERGKSLLDGVPRGPEPGQQQPQAAAPLPPQPGPPAQESTTLISDP